jgi:HAD superfamily hydrolase (TIGR01509 family)
MIKGILFDMDGVLIDARDWHYQALNQSLSPFGFSIDENLHLSRLDGLPTKVKLDFLTRYQGFPSTLHSLIFNLKQDLTLRIASYNCKPNVQHIEMLKKIKHLDLKIGVVTNSISKTSKLMLELSGILEYLDVLITNEDVLRNKPFPEPYLKALELLHLENDEVLVVEDSSHGIESAKSAKCQVIEIKNPDDLNWNLIMSALQK